MMTKVNVIEKVLNLLDLNGNGVITITELILQMHGILLSLDQKNWSPERELIDTFIKSKCAELDRLYDAENDLPPIH